MLNVLLLVVGVALLAVGGEALIRGALAAARRLGVSLLLRQQAIISCTFFIDFATENGRLRSVSVQVIFSRCLSGLVIVGFGTSTPELVVSVDAAISGRADIAIGNVVGSNIGNIFRYCGL